MLEMRHAPGIRMKTGGARLEILKNATWSGDVHENKGGIDKKSGEMHGLFTKMRLSYDHRQQSSGLVGRRCTNYAINRKELAPAHRACRELGKWLRKVGGHGRPADEGHGRDPEGSAQASQCHKRLAVGGAGRPRYKLPPLSIMY
jgi:hypothetical protein